MSNAFNPKENKDEKTNAPKSNFFHGVDGDVKPSAVKEYSQQEIDQAIFWHGEPSSKPASVSVNAVKEEPKHWYFGFIR